MKQVQVPKITVLTVSLNQARFLERAMLSVIEQGYPNLEYIVIDGNSSDDSQAIIQRLEQHLYYWVSEKDQGQSHAFRKAIAHATGDLVTWVNADDVLLPGALRSVAQAWREGARWITGQILWIDGEDRIFRCSRLPRYSDFFARRGMLNAGGPSTFFALDLYKRSPGFGLDYHYAMDTELWYQFVDLGERFVRLNSYLMGFRFHAESKCSEEQLCRDAEKQRAIMGRKQAENDRLLSTHGLKRPSGAIHLLHRVRQAANGNYVLGALDGLRWRGVTWQKAFSKER